MKIITQLIFGSALALSPTERGPQPATQLNSPYPPAVPGVCSTYPDAANSDIPVDSFIWDAETDDRSAGGVGLAIVSRWLDRRPGSLIVHTALNTLDGCLAADLDLIDGKRIIQILPDWLTSRVKDGVIFEAVYSDGKDRSSKRHRGVFLVPPDPGQPGFFLFELDESKFRAAGRRVDTEPDFTFTDQGLVPNGRVMKNPRLAPKPTINPLPPCPPWKFHPHSCVAAGAK